MGSHSSLNNNLFKTKVHAEYTTQPNREVKGPQQLKTPAGATPVNLEQETPTAGLFN